MPIVKHHELKTDPNAFRASELGVKPWEIRRDDRGFQVGDLVTLRETKASGADMRAGAPLEYTGREREGRIAYIMHGPRYGLERGWCIFSLVEDVRCSFTLGTG